jgi:hypothetical protein
MWLRFTVCICDEPAHHQSRCTRGAPGPNDNGVDRRSAHAKHPRHATTKSPMPGVNKRLSSTTASPTPKNSLAARVDHSLAKP